METAARLLHAWLGNGQKAVHSCLHAKIAQSTPRSTCMDVTVHDITQGQGMYNPFDLLGRHLEIQNIGQVTRDALQLKFLLMLQRCYFALRGLDLLLSFHQFLLTILDLLCQSLHMPANLVSFTKVSLQVTQGSLMFAVSLVSNGHAQV